MACAIPLSANRRQRRFCGRSSEGSQIFYRGRLIAEMDLCRRHQRFILKRYPVQVYGEAGRKRRAA